MRLTNSIREDLALKTIKETFGKDVESEKKAEAALAKKAYESLFDPKILTAVKKLPKEWVKFDNCLRFNIRGMSITLCMPEPGVVVPRTIGCTSLGVLSGDLGEEVVAFAEKKRDNYNARKDAQRKVYNMLVQLQTIKQLQDTWPEGKKFYADLLKVKEGSALPAIRIEEVNAALGLASK